MVSTEPIAELALRSHDAGWDRERWARLPDDGNRYEVIDGVLYMTTSPSFFHQWILHQVFLALFQQIEAPGVGIVIWSPVGVFMPGCDPVQPDLLVIRTADLGIIHDRRIYGVPALLVEVLSPSNPEQDREIKRRAYARAGVPEFWILDPGGRDAVVHSDPDPATGAYRRVERIAADGILASPTLPFRAPIADFFANAPDTTL